MCVKQSRLRLYTALPRALLLLLPLLLSPSGCALLSGEREFRYRLPPLPPAWRALEGEARFAVQVYDVTGTARQEITGLEPGQELSLRLPKEQRRLILAELRVPAAGAVFPSRPYGALYPPPRDLDPVPLRGADGWGVALLLDLARAGFDLSAFNVPRFLARCREVGGEDSWALDREAVVAALAEGSFRETAVKEAERFAVEIALPPGEWIPANPALGDQAPAGLEGGLRGSLERELPVGIYRFLRLGDRRQFHLSVGAGGTLTGMLLR